MKDQKELKAKYMDIIKTEVWEGSEHMQQYADKTAAYIVELDNGDITDIDKPSIKTHFCFGHGMYGISTEEDEQRSSEMARHARTSVEYFMQENLSGIDNMIENLKDPQMKKYKYVKYCGCPDTSKLKCFSVCRLGHSPEWEPAYWSNCRSLEELTPEEVDRLIEGYQAVREKFVKRLNTYLKRYGLSKLDVWTYLRD